MRNLRLESGEILQINATAGNTLQGSINYRRGKEFNAKEETHRFTHTGTGANVALFTAPSTGITITGWSIYNSGAAAANFSMRISGNLTGNEVIGLATQNRWTQDGTFTATGQLVSSGTPGTNATAFVTITNNQTISAGAKTLAYANTPNRAWSTGSRIKLTSLANVNNYMEGTVTGTPTNTATNVTIDVINGAAGPFTDFVLTVSAAQGIQGPIGPIGLTGAPASTDIRTGVALVANGTLTINTTLNGNFSDHAIYTNQITGGATENNLIDIINASGEKYYYIAIERDATAGTKTINFAGAGRTYNRDWGSSALSIGVNDKWIFIVHARSATEFDVIAHKVQ